MDKSRCTAITKAGKPCPHYALAGKVVCFAHADSETKAEHGRRGAEATNAKARAERAERAAALRMACVEDLRTTLQTAMREAYTDGDWSVVVSAVRTGIELIKNDQERRIEDLADKVEQFIASRSLQ